MHVSYVFVPVGHTKKVLVAPAAVVGLNFKVIPVEVQLALPFVPQSFATEVALHAFSPFSYIQMVLEVGHECNRCSIGFGTHGAFVQL